MSALDFSLHPQLQADSTFIADLPLSRALLINDSHYPWVVLVPRRANATDIYKLSKSDQQQLLLESEQTCLAMESLFFPDKMNVAAIGNMVPQLHMHHVARYQNDIAWPAPVWGHTPAERYEEQVLQQRVQQLKATLQAV